MVGPNLNFTGKKKKALKEAEIPASTGFPWAWKKRTYTSACNRGRFWQATEITLAISRWVGNRQGGCTRNKCLPSTIPEHNCPSPLLAYTYNVLDPSIIYVITSASHKSVYRYQSTMSNTSSRTGPSTKITHTGGEKKNKKTPKNTGL